MRVLAVIPARYASTRFEGKPLAMLGGREIIERVYERVASVFEDVVVATDDERILNAVEKFGGRAVMTSVEHKSGTDRCFEALQKVGKEFDIVVNVQGDEPFVAAEQLRSIVGCFDDVNIDIATLVKAYSSDDRIESLEDANQPKVVIDKSSHAIYFSRSIVPFVRGVERSQWLKCHTFYKHIGLYAFRVKALQEVTSLPQSPLEIAESLEQLRWIENGYKIGVAESTIETIGIDTPEDLRRAEEFLKTNNPIGDRLLRKID